MAGSVGSGGGWWWKRGKIRKEGAQLTLPLLCFQVPLVLASIGVCVRGREGGGKAEGEKVRK